MARPFQFDIDFDAISPEIYALLQDVPLALPPPGVTPNFVNPETNNLGIYIACGICIPVILITATGRYVTKMTAGTKKLNWTDGVFALCLVLTLLYLALTLVSTRSVVGRHLYDLRVRDVPPKDLLLTMVAQILWPAAVLLVKISVLLMYIEVFGIHRWLRWTCYGTIVVMTAFHLSSSLFYSIACRPRHGHDDVAILMGFLSKQCGDVFRLFVMQSAANLVEDLVLMILPLPCVWALKMPTKQKIGLSAMFCFGICGVISSVISLYFRAKLAKTTDQPWDGVYAIYSGTFEMMVGIVLVCLPQLVVLVKRWPQIKQSFSSNTSKRHHHSYTTPTTYTSTTNNNNISQTEEANLHHHPQALQSRIKNWQHFSRLRIWERVPSHESEKPPRGFFFGRDQRHNRSHSNDDTGYKHGPAFEAQDTFSESRTAAATSHQGHTRRPTRTWSCHGGIKGQQQDDEDDDSKTTNSVSIPMHDRTQQKQNNQNSIKKQTEFSVHVIEE